MKRQNLSFLLILLMSMMGLSVTAHDIAVENSDGVTIYYNWINDNTELSVTSGDGYSGNVVIPKLVSYGGATYSVTEIGQGAFSDCTSLTSISLPSSLTSIGDWAFSNTGISSVSIPEGITDIKGRVFNSCQNLISIVFPSSLKYIGEYAFAGCASLSKINLPESLETIGKESFSYCPLIKNVTIPASVNIIGEGVFMNCNELESVTMKNANPADIASNTFSNCDNAILYVPRGSRTRYLTEYFWKDFKEIIETDYDYSGTIYSDGDIRPNGTFSWIVSGVRMKFRIVDEEAKTVEVGNGLVASIDNSTVGEITIPSQIALSNGSYTVVGLGEKAFSDCTALTNVQMPNGILYIGRYAFWHCEELTSINIPEGTQRLDYDCFACCKSVTSVYIPSSVTSITWDHNVFEGCTNLSTITVAEDNPVFDSRNRCNAIIETVENKLRIGCKGTIIPDDIAIIGHSSFSNMGDLSGLTIPASVTNIIAYAFWGCSFSSITSYIQTPFETSCVFDHLTEGATLYVPIGTKNAYQSKAEWNNFQNIVEMDEDLKTRTIHVATAGTLSDLISEADKYNIEELTLTGKLNGTDFRLLRDMAGNNYLGQITEGNLKVLDLSGAQIVEGGENYLDAECIYFNDYMWKNGPIQYGIIDKDEFPKCVFCGCKLQSIILPDGIIRIGSSAFDQCPNLKTVLIPKSVTVIEDNAFFSDENLQRIDLPNGLKTIESYAFCGCSSFEEMVIPETTETIGSFAFIGCSNITSLNIPASVKSIGIGITGTGSDKLISLTVSPDNTVYDSREGCNAIIETRTNKLIAGCETTVIPQSVTCIGNRAFIHRMGYKSIVIPQNVTSIEEYAYGGCENVETLVLHAGIEKIEEGAFNGNKCLKTIHAYWPTPLAIKVNTFNSVNKDEVTLYVPYGSKSLYEQTDVWKDFKNIVEMEMDPDAPIDFADAEVKRICVENWDSNEDGELSYGEAAAVTDLGQVFKSNKTIISFDELVYFSGLATISGYAFDGCNNLYTVILPSNINKICSGAFQNCYKLKKIIIPNVVEEIETAAFNNDQDLGEVSLSSSLKKIGEAAFSNCSSLMMIIIPASVTSIYDNPFSGCSKIQSVVVENDNLVYDSRENSNAIIRTQDNELIAGFSTTVIPNTVEIIGEGAFFKTVTERSEIVIPHSVTSIEKYAFTFCSALQSITIPSSVTYISNHAFSWASNLASIVVEEGNTVYDSRDNCNAIIRTESNELIAGCKNTVIPSSVTSIANGAFWGCQNMNSINIPQSVISIGEGAFYFITSLSEITLPASLANIEKEAFSKCSALTKVTSKIAIPFEFGLKAFQGISPSCTLYIPLGAREAYISAGWTEQVFGGGIVEVKPDNFLYAEETTMKLGGKKTIALQLDNVTPLIAAEFWLQLPAGLTIEKDENNNLVAAIVGDRRVNHTLTVKDEGNGLYHFLSYSNPIRAYNGNSGDFITLSIVSDGSMEEGTYTATLNNIIFSDENEQKLTFVDSSFNISVINYTPGDANGDGSLDVMDVVKMVSHIMGRNPSNFNQIAADIDGNGKVNVMDLVNLINLIMSTPQQTSAIAPHAQSGSMELSRNGDEAITVSIPFADRHVAAQFVVSLTDGAVLQEVMADEAHQSKFTRMSDGRYKVMVFSGSNAAFNSNSPIRLQLSGNGDVKIEDALFVDTDEEAVIFESAALNTTGINAVGTTFAQPVDIYTVGGKLVKNGATSTKGLAKGVYVVNNQKLIVK